MKMNKEQFLKTEFGGELESTITAWDDALSRNREDKEVLENTGMVSGTVGSLPDGDQTLLRSGISLYQNG